MFAAELNAQSDIVTITWFKFGDDRFRGVASAEGQILPFPSTLTVVLVSICPEVDYP